MSEELDHLQPLYIIKNFLNPKNQHFELLTRHARIRKGQKILRPSVNKGSTAGLAGKLLFSSIASLQLLNF